MPIQLDEAQLRALRCGGELALLRTLYAWNAFMAVGAVIAVAAMPRLLIVIASYGAVFAVTAFLSWKLAYWFVFGNSVRVGPSQFPEVYAIIKQTSAALGLASTPTAFVLQGHGLVELFVAKRFSRRGMILLTSNLLDDLTFRGDTRALAMIIGRQLGHIRAGHFDWWFAKDVVGALTVFVYAAYRRRCHLTADRIGLLAAGDAREARQALLALTVGKTLSPETNHDALVEQEAELRDSGFAWLRAIFSGHPYMLSRIVSLDHFDREVAMQRIKDDSGRPVHLFSVQHYHFTGVSIGTQVLGDHTTIRTGS